MISKTNIFVFLKNLEGFVKNVPIDPRSPGRRRWETKRTVMKTGLDDVFKTLMSKEFQGGLRIFSLLRPEKGCGPIMVKGTAGKWELKKELRYKRPGDIKR